MTESPMNEGTVHLIGAFERENFGDLLFVFESRRYLREGQGVRLTGPFPASTQGFLGADLTPWVNAVATETPKRLWVVGGEVGGVSLEYAYRMSSATDDAEHWETRSEAARLRILEEASGMHARSQAYIPRMSGNAKTMNSRIVLNSVGLRSLRSTVGSTRDEAIGALREASYISVRDSSSSAFLHSIGLPHVVAPDIVQAIDPSSISPIGEDYSLVQIREVDLIEIGVEEFARTLTRLHREFHLPIRLFAAGSARLHDSAERYAEVVAAVQAMSTTANVSISTSASPMEKTAEIAGSKLWVGTSLHGLIVSSAFNVPRVGLRNDKVTRYAATWDEKMPFDVSWDRVLDASVSAMSFKDSAGLRARSAELADLATESARRAAAALFEGSQAADPSWRTEHAARIARRRGHLMHRTLDRHAPILSRAQGAWSRIRHGVL